jgi:uncharacterized membrane protein
MADIASEGLHVIRTVYPWIVEEVAVNPVADEGIIDVPSEVVTHKGDPGVVQALDIPGLTDLAVRSRCTIEVVPQVGDFVTDQDELFKVYSTDFNITAGQLFDHIAMEQERTLEQDPAFAFRIIVDIASKALSPAINDPTTAVLALDQIHILLREVGLRRLDTGRVYDPNGKLVLVYRTPNWEDFVTLAVTEIRQFGCGSIQVVRRMRAMLEDLIPLLPNYRAVILQHELELLQLAINQAFPLPEDRKRAQFPDSQGLGGSEKSTPTRRSYPLQSPLGEPEAEAGRR